MYFDLVYSEILCSMNGSFAVANPSPTRGSNYYKSIITPTDITPAGPKQKCSPPMTHDLAKMMINKLAYSIKNSYQMSKSTSLEEHFKTRSISLLLFK